MQAEFDTRSVGLNDLLLIEEEALGRMEQALNQYIAEQERLENSREKTWEAYLKLHLPDLAISTRNRLAERFPGFMTIEVESVFIQNRKRYLVMRPAGYAEALEDLRIKFAEFIFSNEEGPVPPLDRAIVMLRHQISALTEVIELKRRLIEKLATAP